MKAFTVGMACYDDYDGVVFTIQSLRIACGFFGAEYVVVDNNPDARSGKDTKNFCDKIGAKYVPMPSPVGTTAPRERVFKEASGEYVLCVDSHVVIPPQAIDRLVGDVLDSKIGDDIYSGPILDDAGSVMATEFAPVWRSQMWGVWSTDHRGLSPGGDPYPIWGQGLGLFLAKRSSWLGFNPHFRGFGGEEGYIHEKYRRAGRQAICLPYLRWWHRFGRPGGATYPHTIYQKARNYVLGHSELGLPLDPIHEHFVAGGLLTENNWKFLLSDPIVREHAPGYNPNSPLRSKPSDFQRKTLDELFVEVAETKRDLDEYAKPIRALAMSCRTIVAIVKRQEWNVILAAARPTHLYVYQKESGRYLAQVHDAIQAEVANPPRNYTTSIVSDLSPDAIGEIPPCDMLVLDTINHRDHLAAELERYAGSVSRRILIRGTGAFGEVAEGGVPGQFEAIQMFLIKHPEWFVMLHTTHQWGMTIISKAKEEKPPTDIIPWPAPGYGPGTELHLILESIGINPSSSCDCRGKQNLMDHWGVDGCRARFDEIVGWMKNNHERWGWRDKLAAATKAITTGLAFKLDVLDPFPGLIEEAIRRAEAKIPATQ